MVRGRKSELTREGLALRKEMGLNFLEPLICFSLCDYLSIPKVSFGEMISYHPNEQGLLSMVYAKGKKKEDKISAVMVCREGSDLIIFNEAHADARIQNSVVHEIAHYYLGHKAMLTVTGEEHFFRGDSKVEDKEANHLTACLLIPEEGMYAILKKGNSLADVAEHYKVSKELVRMRFNLTGGRKRLPNVR